MPGLLRMGGRSFPPHIKVTAHQPPQRFFEETVVVNHYTNTDKLIPAIPGFKTSAAFLASLSANLRIEPDLPSPLGTPNFRSSYSHGLPLPPPSPLSFSTLSSHHAYASTEPTTMSLQSTAPAPSAPADALPALSTYTAAVEDDRIDGLKLVADSVAQQRQLSSKMLIFHPANLALYAVFVAILISYLQRAGHDWIMIGTLLGGLTMSCFAAVRWAAGGYIGLAEEINWEWLGEDRLVVVKWGEEIIGALVLGWADSELKKKGGRRKRGKAVVRAWTVKLKYRGKGIGEALLEEAVKVAGEKGADGIVFDAEHANSRRLLPAFYNGFLDKGEARAEKALEKVADEKGNFRQRRSSPTWGSR